MNAGRIVPLLLPSAAPKSNEGIRKRQRSLWSRTLFPFRSCPNSIHPIARDMGFCLLSYNFVQNTGIMPLSQTICNSILSRLSTRNHIIISSSLLPPSPNHTLWMKHSRLADLPGPNQRQIHRSGRAKAGHSQWRYTRTGRTRTIRDYPVGRCLYSLFANGVFSVDYEDLEPASHRPAEIEGAGAHEHVSGRIRDGMQGWDMGTWRML